MVLGSRQVKAPDFLSNMCSIMIGDMTASRRQPPRPEPPPPEPANGFPDLDRPDTSEDWEQVRRSVAMLPPGAWALTREEALRALQTLVRCLRA